MGITEGLAAIKATMDVVKITADLLDRPDLNRDKVRGNLTEILSHVFNAHLALNDAQQQISDLTRQL